MARIVVDGWTVPGFTHVQELGGGSTPNRVLLALDDLTQTKVAIKYLDPRLDVDEAFLSRLRGIARSLSQLEDPNVVDFYELVESPEGTAIVMERVDGFGLRRLIATQGSTGPLAALAILSGTLLGLAAAHGKGVVHGALRPSEILLDDDGNCRLVDFGLAPVGTEARTAPAYTAPELWGGGTPANSGTDMYAATAIFYECLTGTQPYTGRNQSAIGKAHREAPIPLEAIPEPLRGLVGQGLAKDPAARPASAADFLGAVEDAAVDAYGPSWLAQGRGRLIELTADTAQRPEPVPAKAPKAGKAPKPSKNHAPAPPPAPPGPGSVAGPAPVASSPSAPERGRGKAVAAAAVAVLLIAGGTAGAALYLGGDGDPAPATPATSGTPTPAIPPDPTDPAAAALADGITQATARTPGASFAYRRSGCCGGAASGKGLLKVVPEGSPSYNMTISGTGDTRRATRAVIVGETAHIMVGKKWTQAPVDGQAPGFPGLIAHARWSSTVANVTALLRSSDTFKEAGGVYRGTAPTGDLAQVPAVGALYAQLAQATGAQKVAFALKVDRANRPVHLWFKIQGTDKAHAQTVSTTYSGWGRKVAITAPGTPR
ncbi:protein kinase [Actinomadura sp. 9N407]|uniref:serine/threonine-protein kinase n=1 Tax=Actinomadura sp. 9N407 TaxID=3375154 RepID=UPI0037875B53